MPKSRSNWNDARIGSDIFFQQIKITFLWLYCNDGGLRKLVGKKDRGKTNICSRVDNYFWPFDSFKAIFLFGKNLSINFNIRSFQPKCKRMLDARRKNFY